MTPAPFASRVERVVARMNDLDVDSLLLSVGPDLPWLTGYEAMPLERITMAVLRRDGRCTLVVPRLEVDRVIPREHFTIVAWDETDDPIANIALHVGDAETIAFGDRTWARFLIELQAAIPNRRWVRSNNVTGPLRAIKDAHEIEMLARAGSIVDEIAGELQRGEIPLVGRTEAEVSAELGRRIVERGHARVNFAIVAAGANAASPHHEPGSRVIEANEVVLCDFGGTLLDDWGVGYCSDITRCVWTGEVPAEAAEVYELLERAQAAGRAAGVVGATCESVDAACREIIADGGRGSHFIHRTGHGIGVEEHEDPYMVEGNGELLRAGNAYSVEPGIYLAGRYGFRLEDIMVATDDGPRALNNAPRGLAAVRER
ncbi:MAG: aminopeptidase P family protein [Actinobacteria bacterium]|nr:aminopeptidase P family protein [Actinomycetota bacterium]